jgi:hypothetical protein
MDVSASLPSARIPTGVARSFIVALVAAAFLLGGTGGYLVRGLSSAAPATTHPFVIEQAPYSSPRPSPAPPPTLTPDGFTIPI